MTTSEILSRLEGVKGRDGQWIARCPAHSDKKQSLSISEGKGGKTVLHCHAGCGVESIVQALGITMNDLFTEKRERKPEAKSKSRPKIVKVYNYRDETGATVLQKCRYEDKSFTWRRPDGKGGWIWKRGDIPHRLYVAGDLSKPGIAVCEGEKDADSLHALGIDAVSGENGAGPGKWLPEYTEQLKGKTVVIFGDNDEVGRAYAEETANALHGVAKSVQLFDLRTVWPEIPEHGDVSDLIAALGTNRANDLVTYLIANTPEWIPTAKADSEADKIASMLICADTVEYTPPKWLIEPYFQRGKGTLIQADPGTGKTAFMCAVAAAVSTGNRLNGLEVETPGNVLMLSVEDDLGILRGRVEANGGDLSKIHFMANTTELTINSPEIEQAIKYTKAKLIVFDPLQAFLGSHIDMFRANETRPALARLFDVCDRNDCACAIIAHMGKNGMGKSPVNQSLGSVDIPAAMRSVLQITRNPEDNRECLAVHIKSSNAAKGKSLAFEIVERGGIKWNGFSDFGIEDLNAVQKRKEKGIPYENEPLVRVFNQLITDRPGGGKWTYAEVKSIGSKLLGFPPFDDSRELSAKLNAGLARELQKRDGLIVICGERVGSKNRGIRIEQYQHPEMYQTSIQE